MSWKATAWAKSTRGHRGLSSKLLLLVLSDYHDEEKNMAWPSQKKLSEDCEMPIRTVKYTLDLLEKQGFITTLQKGNQYQPSQYRLNFSIALAQDYEGAKSEGATIAPASEGAKDSKVKVQPAASESTELDTILYTSLQEPPIEPPVLSYGEYVQALDILRTIPGYARDDKKETQLVSYLTKHNILPDRAEETAVSIQAKVCFERGRWSYNTAAGKQWAGDLCGLLKAWAKRPSFQPTYGGSNGATRPGRIDATPKEHLPSIDELAAASLKRWGNHIPGDPNEFGTATRKQPD